MYLNPLFCRFVELQRNLISNNIFAIKFYTIITGTDCKINYRKKPRGSSASEALIVCLTAKKCFINLNKANEYIIR